MQINREDVVQAALKVERWCDEKQDEYGNCDCPFSTPRRTCLFTRGVASNWGLEEYLRNRGMKHDD